MVPEEAHARDDGCGGESQFAGLPADPGCQALRSKFGVVRAEAEQWPDRTGNTRDDHVSGRDAEKRWIISIAYVPRLKNRCQFHIDTPLRSEISYLATWHFIVNSRLVCQC